MEKIQNFQKTTLEGNQSHDLIMSFAETLDFLNIQILRKFYATGEPFPNDTRPYVFSMLYMEMKSANKIQIGIEAMRKRVDALVEMGLLKKAARSNPASYHPVKGIEQSIRAVIKRFMMNNNITHV